MSLLLKIALTLILTVGIPVITFFIKSFTPAAAFVACAMLLTIRFASEECLYLIVIAFASIILIEKIFSNTAQKHSTRKTSQLLANGGCATLAALLYLLTHQNIFLTAFVAAITEALCDSAASAVGTRIRGKCIDICTFSVLESGISGGISLAGSLSCVLCAAFMAIMSLAFHVTTVVSAVIVFLSGVCGCFFDSYLGSRWQRKYRCSICGKITEETTHCGQKTEVSSGKKHLDNDAVNFLSNAFSLLMVFLLAFVTVNPWGQKFLFHGLLLTFSFVCSGIIHETGHMLGCFLSSCKIRSVTVLFWEIDFQNKKVHLCRNANNFCKFSTTSKKRQLFAVAMGPACNALVAIIICCLPASKNSVLGVCLVVCNVFKAITNLIPVGARDGAAILQILQRRKK